MSLSVVLLSMKVAAAVTSSAGGAYSVLVVEPLHMIGGMAAAGGVALMNQGGCGLSGLSGNWSRIVSNLYGLEDGVTFPRMKESEIAFWTLLNSSKSIETVLGCHVVDVSFSGEGCISLVYFDCEEKEAFSVEATYVIDASYDGDIMVLANVDHTSGRESRNHYKESLAGVQVRDFSAEESFALQNMSINPFYSNGTLLKYIDPTPLGKDGEADDKLMAFEYFVCLSPTPTNQVPFDRPPGYNADDFILLLRQTLALMSNGQYPAGPPLSYFGDVQCYDPIVKNNTGNQNCLFCCGQGPVNSDQPNMNHGWASSDFKTRQRMAEDHKYYIKGSLYFLANDPRVPEFTRQDALRYGYCRDEYAENGNFPPQLYVRVSNRLKGQKVLTQNNIANPRTKEDGVAMGCWPLYVASLLVCLIVAIVPGTNLNTSDQHIVSRHVVSDGGTQFSMKNEGFFRARIGSGRRIVRNTNSARMRNQFSWYDVPFGVMVPATSAQARNLLVPVCISASAVAYTSTRIENMFMDLGSAAGVAVASLLRAAPSHRKNSCPELTVQDDVNITAVQDILSRVYKQKFHGPTVHYQPQSAAVRSG